MATRRSRIPHVPGDGEVITAPSSSSRLDCENSDDATEPVTLASLAQEIEGLKAQVAIMVEWLETLGERLDRLEPRLPNGD